MNQRLKRLEDKVETLERQAAESKDKVETLEQKAAESDADMYRLHRWELLSQAIEGAWRRLSHIFALNQCFHRFEFVSVDKSPPAAAAGRTRGDWYLQMYVHINPTW
jgi:septal ring factor EnvC (AmiA/AmiB activator)